MLLSLLGDLDIPPSDLSEHPDVQAQYESIRRSTGISIEHYNNNDAILYRYVHVPPAHVQPFGEKAIQDLLYSVSNDAAMSNHLAAETMSRAIADLGQNINRRAYRMVEFERGDLVVTMVTLDPDQNYLIEMLYVVARQGEAYAAYVERQTEQTREDDGQSTFDSSRPRVVLH